MARRGIPRRHRRRDRRIQGGDAIVAWKDKIGSAGSVEGRAHAKVAFTPRSPSEHLLRTVAAHFDVPALRGGKGPWRIETNGSPQALKRLLARKTDAAVLWEPDVTRALGTPGVIKLLSTAETRGLSSTCSSPAARCCSRSRR